MSHNFNSASAKLPAIDTSPGAHGITLIGQRLLLSDGSPLGGAAPPFTVVHTQPHSLLFYNDDSLLESGAEVQVIDQTVQPGAINAREPALCLNEFRIPWEFLRDWVIRLTLQRAEILTSSPPLWWTSITNGKDEE